MVVDYLSSTQSLEKKKFAWQEWFFGATFRIVVLGSLAVLGIFYIIQMSSASTKGYVISDLEKEKNILSQEVRLVQVKIAENRSMNSIQNRLQEMNLVAVTDVEYVTPVGSFVARR